MRPSSGCKGDNRRDSGCKSLIGRGYGKIDRLMCVDGEDGRDAIVVIDDRVNVGRGERDI